MALLNSISIRGKIIALAVTVAIGLVAILWLGNNALTAASERLTLLEQVYYPVLARSTANAQQLERMADTFSTAVTIGELEALANTETLLAAMNDGFKLQREKLPEAAAVIDSLVSQTVTYHRDAKALAAGLIDGSLPMEQVQAKAATVS